MNKMRTISDMRARVQQIIEKEIAKTEKEIADFEEKIHDNEAYYGGASVITDEVYIHSYYCPSCHIKVMLTAGFGEKVECPVCTRPIYKANDGEVMKIVRGSRQAKVHGHYIELTSDGRIKG